MNDVAPGAVTFTTPSVDTTTGKVVITATREISDSSGRVGVLGVDFLLTTLLEQVLAIDLGPNGRAFLINNDGNVLAHPQHTLPGATWDQTDLQVPITSYETSDQAFMDLMDDAIDDDKAGKAHVTYDGDDFLVSMVPLQNGNFTLGLVKPSSEASVSGGISSVRLVMVPLIIAAVLFTAFAVIKFVTRTPKPKSYTDEGPRRRPAASQPQAQRQAPSPTPAEPPPSKVPEPSTTKSEGGSNVTYNIYNIAGDHNIGDQVDVRDSVIQRSQLGGSGNKDDDDDDN